MGGDFQRRPRSGLVTESSGCSFFDEPEPNMSVAPEYARGRADAKATSTAFGHFGEAPSSPLGPLVPPLRDPAAAFPDLAHPGPVRIPSLIPTSAERAMRPDNGLAPARPDFGTRAATALDGRNRAGQPAEGAVPPAPGANVEAERQRQTGTIGPAAIPIPFDETKIIDDAARAKRQAEHSKTASPRPFGGLIDGLRDLYDHVMNGGEQERTNKYIETERAKGNFIHNEDLPGGQAPREKHWYDRFLSPTPTNPPSVPRPLPAAPTPAIGPTGPTGSTGPSSPSPPRELDNLPSPPGGESIRV